jgi:hypothetical protein
MREMNIWMRKMEAACIRFWCIRVQFLGVWDLNIWSWLMWDVKIIWPCLLRRS